MKTFKIGGIHPPDRKLSAGAKIDKSILPDNVIILLNQHIGAPALPVVNKGDYVKTGQLIAESSGFVSSNIHSSVSGKVTKIDEHIDITGFRQKAIHISVEGDEWLEDIDRSDDIIRICNLNSTEITEKIKESGIVGMGGAGFPTHIKLNPPKGKTPEILIVNAVECEPYLTSDHSLMLEKGLEILIGTEILMKALNVKNAVIGIEVNKIDAIENFISLVSDFKGIEIMPLKVLYPQGGEKQLIESVTGKRVPSGALPVDVGAVVQNVATVFAVYEAVQKNKPLFERIVCLTGDNIETPGNYLLRNGMLISDFITKTGGLPDDVSKVVSGGPMMGKAITDLNSPLTKGCSGILAIDSKKAYRKEIRDCIRCAKCVYACPMGLEPFLFMTLAENSDWERLEKELIMDCIECGCCTFSCPSARPLLDYLRLGKNRVGANIRSRK